MCDDVGLVYYLNNFDVYRGKNGDHLIANYDDKNRNYYFTNDETPSTTVRATNPTSTKGFNNSITDNVQNFNPLRRDFDSWSKSLFL